MAMTRRTGAHDPVPDVNVRLGAWHEDAACHGVPGDPGDWISPPYGLADRYRVKQLELAICEQCPVQTQCLDFAIEVGEQHGIWGGLFPDERQRLNLDQRTTVRLP